MASATITVTDDDQWIISAAAGEDHETVERDSGDLAWLTISRSADPNLTSGSASDTRYEIAVDFVLSGGVLGTDYDLLCGQSVITSGTVSIPEGETSVSLSIRPKNDAVKENDMPVTLTITGASSSGVFDSGGSGCCCACWGAGGDFPILQNGDTATVTILDDDHWLISLEESGTPGSPRTIIAEEQTTAVNLTLNRTHDVMTPSRTGDTTYPIDVEFDYAGSKASGGDYVMIHKDKK